MMDKDFLDKLLDQVIEEASTIYVENENLENKKIEDEDVEFSDIHKQKMKQLFKEVRREDNRVKAVRITKKVALVLICATLITIGLITSVEAWRKEVVKFIMKNNDDNYMSINFGDPTNYDELYSGDTKIESGEEIKNTYIDTDIKFLYLPEGIEFKQKILDDTVIYYSFNCQDNYIRLKKESLTNNFKKRSDIENTNNQKINLENKEIFKIIKENGRLSYSWYDELYLYDVTSNIEEVEILKFIENIKILKNF